MLQDVGNWCSLLNHSRTFLAAGQLQVTLSVISLSSRKPVIVIIQNDFSGCNITRLSADSIGVTLLLQPCSQLLEGRLPFVGVVELISVGIRLTHGLDRGI
ncbi:hypothetical protein D3C81_2046820 [compost metagenome]